jgi:hypothetical protein
VIGGGEHSQEQQAVVGLCLGVLAEIASHTGDSVNQLAAIRVFECSGFAPSQVLVARHPFRHCSNSKPAAYKSSHLFSAPLMFRHQISSVGLGRWIAKLNHDVHLAVSKTARASAARAALSI